MSEKITAKIAKNGDSTVTVTGVKGRKCHDLTLGLERELGIVISVEETSEAYERETTARDREHITQR